MMFFASNQKKQKAFDRNYNAMAKSDYAQGHKLQALIKNEAMNDALTDKLAQLYASSVNKAHNYEYDRIEHKLKNKVTLPEKRTHSPSTQQSAKSDNPAKRVYVHESTDTQPEYEEKAPAGHKIDLEESKRNREFIKKLSSKYESKDPNSEEFQEKLRKDIDDHLSKNQKIRQKKFKDNRSKISFREIQEAKANLFDEVLNAIGSKRDRSDSTIAELPNQRAKKKSATTVHNIYDELNDQYDTDGEDSDPEIAEEKNLKKQNPGIKKLYTQAINDWSTDVRDKLYKSIRGAFRKDVDARKGKGYFDRNVTRPGRYGKGVDPELMKQYKKDLKGELDGIFI